MIPIDPTAIIGAVASAVTSRLPDDPTLPPPAPTMTAAVAADIGVKVIIALALGGMTTEQQAGAMGEYKANLAKISSAKWAEFLGPLDWKAVLAFFMGAMTTQQQTDAREEYKDNLAKISSPKWTAFLTGE